MANADDHSPAASAERSEGLCIAAVFGSFFLLFLTGLVFPNDPEATALDYILLAAVATWSGLMSAGGVAMLLRRRWTERIVDLALSTSAVVLVCGFAGSACWRTWERMGRHEAALPGDAALFVLMLFWFGFSMLLWWSGRRSKDSLDLSASLLLWPLLLLMKAPALFAMLFGLLLLFVLGGDWLGSQLGRPYLGAVLGFGGLVALLGFLAHLSRRWV